MMDLQIDFNWGQSSHSYAYLKNVNETEIKEKVNELVKQKLEIRNQRNSMIFTPDRLSEPRSIIVREYDRKTNKPVKGGFKNHLAKITYTIKEFRMV